MSRKDVVQSHIEVLMRDYLGVEELKIGRDGEIPVRHGSAVYNVRVARGEQQHPHVEVYAIVVDGVDADPGLYEALNGINRRLSHLRTFWVDRKVVLAGEVVGDTLDLADLACMCDEIGSAADVEGPALSAVYGGCVATTDEEDE